MGLIGCATGSRETVARLDQIPKDQVYPSNSSIEKILKDLKSNSVGLQITELKLGETIQNSVTDKDPLITLTQEGKPYRSNYKLYKFNQAKAGKINLDVRSYCDCFGFRKFLFVPTVQIYSSSGLAIMSEVVVPGRSENDDAPIHMKVKARLPQKGQYYIMIASDNSHRGGPVGAMSSMPLYVGKSSSSSGADLDYQGYPYGTYKIQLASTK